MAADRRKRSRVNARRGTRVLIIADAPSIVAILSRMLHSAGCQMLEASDAETGIALAAKEQPDLIFLDIVLPGISGFTALRTLRYDVRTLHIPVILMTGNKSAASQLLRTRLDIEDLLIKPFSRRDVFLRIERLLDVHLIPRRKPRRASGRRKKPRKNEPRS